MAEDNSAKITLVTAIIGAVGAIAAAMLPIYLNKSAPDPAPPSAKADPAPEVAKPSRDPGPKGVARADSKAGVAGHGAQPKGPTARTPKAEHKTVPSDLARLQGDWAVVAQTKGSKVWTKDEIARTKTAWEFDGNKMAIRNHGDSPGLVYYQGSIKVHPDRSPRAFDFTGKNRMGQACEMLGIYAFEGSALVVRFRIHNSGDGAKPSRPDSFEIEPDPNAGHLVRLRRVKE